MDAQHATIVVVPRERFSFAAPSLTSVLEHRDPRTELVYVDGGSPPLVRQFLEQRAMRHGFRLISTERYLSPNAARNLALEHVSTPYVALVDNDVLVTPGWLDALIRCAEQTGAWVVGPTVCTGDPAAGRIRTAGGDLELPSTGSRTLRASCRHHGQRLAEIATELRRQPIGQVPFHAVLIRTSALRNIGTLDEQLLSTLQHTDFCLRTRQSGGTVYFEPSAVVAHVPPPPFEETDLPYFQLRWSDAWNRASIEHFRRKWNLAEDDPHLAVQLQRLDTHRRLPLEPYRRLLRLLGSRPAHWVENVLIAPWEQAASRRRVPAVEPQLSPLRKAA